MCHGNIVFNLIFFILIFFTIILLLLYISCNSTQATTYIKNIIIIKCDPILEKPTYRAKVRFELCAFLVQNIV